MLIVFSCFVNLGFVVYSSAMLLCCILLVLFWLGFTLLLCGLVCGVLLLAEGFVDLLFSRMF